MRKSWAIIVAVMMVNFQVGIILIVHSLDCATASMGKVSDSMGCATDICLSGSVGTFYLIYGFDRNKQQLY